MTIALAPRLDILPPPQRRLWDELHDIPPEFVLYGGTAIALHLGHVSRSISTSSALRCVVERGGQVKLSFFGLPNIPRLHPPFVAPDNGLQVASLLDLAGMKASVVQMRAEAKDYIDIDAILTDGRIDLPMALASARAIYGEQFNPQITLKALSYFEDGNLRRLPQDMKNPLAGAARAVDLDNLPVIAFSGSSREE